MQVVLYGGPPGHDMTGQIVEIGSADNGLNISYKDPDVYEPLLYSGWAKTYTTSYSDYKVGSFKKTNSTEGYEEVWAWEDMSSQDMTVLWQERNAIKYFTTNHIQWDKPKPKFQPGENCLF